jgi:hypothetical protein
VTATNGQQQCCGGRAVVTGSARGGGSFEEVEVTCNDDFKIRHLECRLAYLLWQTLPQKRVGRTLTYPLDEPTCQSSFAASSEGAAPRGAAPAPPYAKHGFPSVACDPRPVIDELW